ncbi:hypothetical protein F383_10034 [Gossypium arboreum]|uniref:Uncharacterized protein n=1 Tax=Gossypium arboreum TaxID=29729 RepID=A0A0B0PNU8_GOSAR|nr:hypothetical protein F383_10034 [Gossypium arboreum]
MENNLISTGPSISTSKVAVGDVTYE